MVPGLIPVFGSQPAGDVSHKPGGRLLLLSARPAVTPATLKGTLHSVEKTLIQKAYCVYYYILKERRFFYVD